MKRIGSAVQDAAVASAAERWRSYPWCRHWNGFLDDPKFRVVAQRLNLPLHQVQAFVAKLDSFANQAEPRGYVGHFSAAEFGVGCGMSEEDAARIFAALSAPDVAWVDQEHVASFYERNRDREDNSAKERKRRQRARADVRKELGRRKHLGLITDEQRDSVEAVLELFPDDELLALKGRLKAGVALEAALSIGRASELMARARFLVSAHAALRPAELSTGHTLSQRDAVTVTPRADQKSIGAPVDNFGHSPGGEAASGQGQQAGPQQVEPSIDVAAWLLSTGLQIVMQRLGDGAGRAEQVIARWRRDLNDDAALKEIIVKADATDLVGARFHNLVVDGKTRAIALRDHPRLPLGPTAVTTTTEPKRRAGNE